MTKKEIYFLLDDMNEICESNISFMNEKLHNNEIFDYCPVPEIRIEIVRLTQERCEKEAEYKKKLQAFLEKELELSQLENSSGNQRKYWDLHLKHMLEKLDFNYYLELYLTKVNTILETLGTLS
ncbi:hypothetical protein H4O18_20765 [Arenibacter sp. BSSL-BM3]|uniref:Uncharacterized protein n=1 Tax=Arenibacter arenosicollis TaxID=2762274 RepID=A0ABR7QTC5_9FLAO|nr:hypothetical protein [Arenibacter arenosicollis]MBC8770439.1 hypothetical protein [Arenibacter arenosicollis]